MKASSIAACTILAASCTFWAVLLAPMGLAFLLPSDEVSKPQKKNFFLTTCKEGLAARRVNYAALMQKKEYAAAASELQLCVDQLNDPQLKSMVDEAKVQSYLAEFNDTNSSLIVRVGAMQRLISDFPSSGAKYETQFKKLESALAKEVEADSKQRAVAAERIAAAEKRRKKSEGVSIGMSKEDVLASKWGKPQSINTTTSSYGTREQWVYGGSNYLYFQDGVLKTIQN